MTAQEQFQRDADRTTADEPRRAFVRKALARLQGQAGRRRATFAGWQHARDAAARTSTRGSIISTTTSRSLRRNSRARGGKVFWASNGEQAREYILKLARGARREIDRQIEGDDERGNPSQRRARRRTATKSSRAISANSSSSSSTSRRIISSSPACTCKREEISALFERELGSAKTDSPEELTMIARRFLRRQYINADMGISGAQLHRRGDGHDFDHGK